MTAAWFRHVRPAMAGLKPYTAPAVDPDWARMNANECAEPWPPEVLDAVAHAVRKVELGRYPEVSGRSLRAVLAAQHDCATSRITLGNGSDEVISTLLTTLGGAGGHVVVPTPTFVMYRHSATVLGMPVVEVPLRPDFSLDHRALADALRGAALCFLARPNNPTGTLWDAAVLEDLIDRFEDTVFVVDEAYVAYAGENDSMWNAKRPENYVHMSTLSKVGGAGVRLGYCIASEALAAELDKARHPYNISATTLAIAELLLTRFGDQRAAMVERGRRARTRIAGLLASLPGVHVYPSAANMVLARFTPPSMAPAFCRHLAEHHVRVKDVSAMPGLAGCVRTSAGTARDLDLFEAAVRTFGEVRAQLIEST